MSERADSARLQALIVAVEREAARLERLIVTEFADSRPRTLGDPHATDEEAGPAADAADH